MLQRTFVSAAKILRDQQVWEYAAGREASAAWREAAGSARRISSAGSTVAQAAEQGAAAGAGAAASPTSAGLAAVPGIVKLLGFGGAIPFIALSPPVADVLPLDLLGESLVNSVGTLQLGYGATILSFLGGVHWGLAMTNVGGAVGLRMAGQRYLWSVMPCLMAWPTLAMPLGQGAATQAALLGLVYFIDRSWAARGMLPKWYMALRLPLTVLAAGGLTATAVTEGAGGGASPVAARGGGVGAGE